MLSILVFSTKKWYSSFLKSVCLFQKIYFKVKVLKSFKISSDCHIKACWSLKWTAILKIPILKEPMLFWLALKWNLYVKVFSCVKTKTNFCCKPSWNAERSNHSFLSNWHVTNLFKGESNIWYPLVTRSVQHFIKRSWTLQSFSFCSKKCLRVLVVIC